MAFLALLTFVALLTLLLALLILLTSVATGAAGLGALLHPAAERLDTAGQLARAIDGVGIPIAAARAERRRRFIELAAEAVDVRVELLFERAREVLQAGLLRPEHLLRVLQLLLDLVVADLTRGFLQLARRLAGLARQLAAVAIELILERGDLLLQRVLALPELLGAGGAIAARGQILHLVGDVALLALNLLGLALRILDVAFGARALRALQLTLDVAQPFGGGRRLARGARIAVRGRALHRVGRLLHLARGLGEIRTILLARQPFEPAGRFFGLLRQRALEIAAARVRRGLTAGLLLPPLQFLLLPPRQLAQLLGQLVDLLIGVLLHRLLIGLGPGSPSCPVRA